MSTQISPNPNRSMSKSYSNTYLKPLNKYLNTKFLRSLVFLGYYDDAFCIFSQTRTMFIYSSHTHTHPLYLLFILFTFHFINFFVHLYLWSSQLFVMLAFFLCVGINWYVVRMRSICHLCVTTTHTPKMVIRWFISFSKRLCY